MRFVLVLRSCHCLCRHVSAPVDLGYNPASSSYFSLRPRCVLIELPINCPWIIWLFESPWQWIASAWFHHLGHRIKPLRYCPCTTGRTNMQENQRETCQHPSGEGSMWIEGNRGDVASRATWRSLGYPSGPNEWEELGVIFHRLVKLGYDVRGL